MAVFTQKQMFELKSLPQVQAKLNDSHIWRGLLKIKEEVLVCGSFLKMGNKRDFGRTLGWAKGHSKNSIHQFTT